jgi:hypothetical protein
MRVLVVGASGAIGSSRFVPRLTARPTSPGSMDGRARRHTTPPAGRGAPSVRSSRSGVWADAPQGPFENQGDVHVEN